jgi:hypothetical protein
MWLLLLDTSGSMADPFSGKSPEGASGRRIETTAEIKFDGARKALLDYVAALPPTDPVALFAFDSRAKLVFEGTAGDINGLRQKLEALETGGGTDIAAAFNAASDHIDQANRRARELHQALLVSDGLSDAADAISAAERLAQRVPIIHVILIDPTEKGQRTAKAVLRGSSMIRVETAAALGEAASTVAAEQASLAREFEQVSKEVEAGVAAVQPEPVSERLAFTAAYPSSLASGVWYSMLVVLHLHGLSDQVRDMLSRAHGRIGTTAATSSSPASRKLRRGTRIVLQPHATGVRFNPESLETAWYEDIQTHEFRVSADRPGVQSLGAVDVLVDGQMIGAIPMALRVRGPADPVSDDGPEIGQASMFERVFASYSHADKDIVDACARVYSALGIYVYIDHQLLRSGQHWRKTLKEHIERSDVFQLFWSTTASASPEVRVEWEQALALRSRKGEWFVRPLYWEVDLPEPPPELQQLHFGRLELPQPQSRRAAPTHTGGQTLLPVAVIPLAGGSADMQQGLVEDLSAAVRYLEDTTGIRYYPAPTLLVDDYIVRSVRKRTVIEPVFDPARVARARQLAQEAQDIALRFHVRFSEPRPTAEFDELFGRGSVLPDQEFDDLRFWAEWGIRGTTDRLLQVGIVDAWELLRGKGVALDQPDQRMVATALAALAIAELSEINPRGVLTPPLYGSLDLSVALPILEAAGVTTYGRDDYNRHLSGERRRLATALEQLLLVPNDEGARRAATAIAAETSVGGHLSEALRPSEPFAPAFKDLETKTLLVSRVLDHGAARLGGEYVTTAARFTQVRSELLALLTAAPAEGIGIEQWFVEQRSTHGVFAPAGSADTDLERWAVQRGLAPAMALAGVPKVLYCLSTRERENELRRDSDKAGLERGFQKCVLIHEHFHALLETGLDEHGARATGPGFRTEWAKATPLNESLAVWMELHYVRGDAAQTSIVEAYMANGPYPDWPYAGAARVEQVFQRDDVDGVRALIRSLRTDPAAAQRHFDSLDSAAPNIV